MARVVPFLILHERITKADALALGGQLDHMFHILVLESSILQLCLMLLPYWIYAVILRLFPFPCLQQIKQDATPIVTLVCF